MLVYNRDGLSFDTRLIPPQVNYGFRVFDGEAELTNLSISIGSDSSEVRIDTGASPSGFRWSYGDIVSTGLAPYSGGAGNLRDSSGYGNIFENWPMHDWGVLQDGIL